MERKHVEVRFESVFHADVYIDDPHAAVDEALAEPIKISIGDALSKITTRDDSVINKITVGDIFMRNFEMVVDT